MTSQTFSTERFRVYITGQTAWVETSSEGNWALQKQHFLPLAPEALQRGDTAVLQAALHDFEQAHNGDQGCELH